MADTASGRIASETLGAMWARAGKACFCALPPMNEQGVTG